jgi:hypothetical protein
MRRLLAAALLVCAAVGCGGGGGSVTSNTNARLLGSAAPLAGRYLEFVNAMDQAVDPFDLQIGDLVRVAIVNYDPQGNRTELTSFSWNVSGPGASLENGRFVRVSDAGAEPFTVSGMATFLDTTITLSAQGRVRQAGTPFSGTVRDVLTNQGVKYVQVNFYSSSGAWVGSSVTNDTGAYSAALSGPAATFTVNPNTINNSNYYRQFRFGGKYYVPGDLQCLAPAGAPPAALVLLPISFGPPPAPDGCS